MPGPRQGQEGGSKCLGFGQDDDSPPLPTGGWFPAWKVLGGGIRGGGGFPEGVGKTGGIRRGQNGLEREEQHTPGDYTAIKNDKCKK